VGRLFSTLPLPILTGLPVHIHGRFSISDDRSRIHGAGDKGVQDHRPQEWNKFLFNQVIPTAWATLLWKISRAYPTENHFHLWPTNRFDTKQLWNNLCPAVVEQISQNRLPVWFTDVGHVTLEDGLLASDTTTLKDKTAFREAKIPVIFAANYLFDQARQQAGSCNLEPRTLYECLRRMESLDHLSRQSRLIILEILLREIPLTDLGALEIFPFCDGIFRSLRLPQVFLHRASSEKALFIQQMKISIDTDQLSDSASKLLQNAVKRDDQVVRYRTPEDLRDYFLKHIANGLGDIIESDEHIIPMLKQVWDWILRYGGNPLPLSALGPLWLIPLRGSGIRKLVPLDGSNFITWFGPGEVNDLSLKISTADSGRSLRILARDVLSDETMRYLHTSAVHESSILLKDGKKFGNFAEFLAQERSLLQIAAEDIKASVLGTLTRLYQSESQANPNFLRNILKSLCIFKAVQWPANATSMKRYWTDMTGDAAFIGLSKLVPVPFSSERVFLDVSDKDERRLLEGMDLMECLDDVQILERIVIPALQNGSYEKTNPSFRLDVANLLFQNYYRISCSARSYLPSLAVVPLQKGEDENDLSFGRPSDILDLQKLTIRNLYFDNEIRLPEQEFYNRFSAALAQCGMVQSLNKDIVLDRIRSYGRSELAFDVVASRAKSLLQMPFPRDITQTDGLTHTLQEHKWLPALTPNMSNCFSNSSVCRDSSDKPIVGHVWPVLPFQIDKSWRSILGWHKSINVNVLMSQLDRSIAAEDIHSVDRTLSYIQQHHAAESYAEHLLKLNFVRSSNGKHANAAIFCRRGAERLTPYLYNVEPRFWNDHSKIMKLTKIPGLPKLEQLKDILRTLDSKNALNEQELDVAVELAHIWGVQFPDAVDELKLPNDNAVLVELSELVFNDTPWLSAGTRAILHRKVSRTIAEQLRIERLSELAKKRDLGIEDPDDDEFDQREEIADGIRDTLDRYTREHTFHEYLANADDCGSASEVNFSFDGTSYGTKHLIDEDLQGLQGPSLLIHNDGSKYILISHI
jgi:sacsin